MLIDIVTHLAAVTAGFGGGVLVYRNNVKLFEAKIEEAQDAFERVNAELQEAYGELEEAKSKLSRKPAGTKAAARKTQTD